jgi:hypothetical protein
MIKRFNEYENKLNEQDLPSWIDEKIVKPAIEYGKPFLSIPGSEGIEIDENIKKLYNTPIGNIPANIYAQLMGIMDGDRAEQLNFTEPLKKDSLMVEVAAKYYIANIVNILNSSANSDLKFNSEGIDDETSKILKDNPITLGTIIRNSLVNWYLSKEPVNELVQSLNTAVIEPKNQNTSESYEDINESRFDAFRKAFSKFFKSGEELGSITKASDDAARAAQSTGKALTYSMHYTPSSSIDDATKNIANAADDVAENIGKAPKEAQEALKNTTTKIKQDADNINLGNVDPTHTQGKPYTKTPDVDSPPKVDSTPKADPSMPTANSSEGDKAKGFWEKFSENLKNKKLKTPDGRGGKGTGKFFTNLRKGLTDSIKAIVNVFTLGGFLFKIPAAAWGILKFGGMAYGIYWIAKWFEKSDSDSAKEPIRELISVFEKDLANQKLEPFFTFDETGERFKKSLESQDITDKIKAWCTSLNNSKIMSDSDYQKCIQQIDSEAFPYYIKANSTASMSFVNSLEREWENHDELPSLGLVTMGLVSAYSSVFHLFEKEFYKGEIPLTADAKNLDKPVGIASRKDSLGQERKYIQIGDEGEDIKMLQTGLKKLGIYSGEADGKYDEDMAKIIASIQTNAKPTSTEIEVNGKADLPTLNYIAKQIEYLSGVVKSSLEGTISQEEYQKRQQTQGYIQQMQSALANR